MHCDMIKARSGPQFDINMQLSCQCFGGVRNPWVIDVCRAGAWVGQDNSMAECALQSVVARLIRVTAGFVRIAGVCFACGFLRIVRKLRYSVLYR